MIIAADDSTDSRRLELLGRFHERPRPDTALATLGPESLAVLTSLAALIGKSPVDDGVRAFVCSAGVCEAPTFDPGVFSRLLENRR